MQNELFGDYAVEYAGTKVGQLTVSSRGLMTRFQSECVMAPGEILRLGILVGDRYIPLGVMLPDGDKLRFDKQYSRNDLRMRGLSSVDGARLLSSQDTHTTMPPPPPPKPTAPPVTPLEPPPIEDAVPSAPPSPSPSPVGDAHLGVPPATPEPATEVIAPTPGPSHVGDAPPRVPPPTDPEPEPEPQPTPPPEPPAPPPPTPTEPPPPDPAPGWEHIRDLGQDASLYTFSTQVEPTPELTPADLAPPAPPPEPQAPWIPQTNPETLFTDPELQLASRGLQGAKTRQSGKRTELAIPFDAGKPFPLMPIFCFGHSETIDGRSYLVFHIEDGKLI